MWQSHTQIELRASLNDGIFPRCDVLDIPDGILSEGRREELGRDSVVRDDDETMAEMLDEEDDQSGDNTRRELGRDSLTPLVESSGDCLPGMAQRGQRLNRPQLVMVAIERHDEDQRGPIHQEARQPDDGESLRAVNVGNVSPIRPLSNTNEWTDPSRSSQELKITVNARW